MGYKYCNRCGAKLPKDADFCTKCGAKQDPIEETADDDESAKVTEAVKAAKPIQASHQTQTTRTSSKGWQPYNQYKQNQFSKGALLATRDALKFNRCVGRSNFWYAYGYLFIVTILLTLISPLLEMTIGVIVDLLTLSLILRRANDSITDKTVKKTVIIIFAVAMLGDIIPALQWIGFVGELTVLAYIGSRKTDWQTQYERPIE